MNDRLEKQTDERFDLNDLLHPARAFSHPSDVVKDPDLTLNEKRRSWHPGLLMSARSSLPQRYDAPRMEGIPSPSTTS